MLIFANTARVITLELDQNAHDIMATRFSTLNGSNDPIDSVIAGYTVPHEYRHYRYISMSNPIFVTEVAQ